MKRLFIGITLPDSLCDELKLLCCGLKGARWVSSENFHLTIKFMGQISADEERKIRAALELFVGESFEIRLSGMGFFPFGRKPETLWVGIEKTPDLLEFQRNINSYLVKKAGIPLDKRSYYPHITLGRVKNVHGKHLMEYFNRHSLIAFESVLVSDFQLFSSVLSPEGARYAVESNYALLLNLNHVIIDPDEL